MKPILFLLAVFCYGEAIAQDVSSDSKSKSKEGQVNLKVAIPEGNWFYVQKAGGFGTSFGFLGISAGVEYYLSDKYSLNLDYGGMVDFFIPFPVPLDRYGPYDIVSARYADLQVGRDWKRWHYDVGLQMNRTLYREYEYDSLASRDSDLKFRQRQFNLGFAGSVDYAITDFFHLGLNYYPSFWGWRDQNYTRMEYTHLIMFELVFKGKIHPAPKPKFRVPVFF